MKTSRGRRGLTLILLLVFAAMLPLVAGVILNATDVQVRRAQQEVLAFRAELLAENALHECLAMKRREHEVSRITEHRLGPTGEEYRFALVDLPDGRREARVEAVVVRPRARQSASLTATLDKAGRIVSFQR